MEAAEYKTLFDHEATHWWFRAIHQTVVDALRAAGVKPGSRVLDAGCGTGQNLARIASGVTPDVYGFDVSSDAARYWPRRGLRTACRASVNEIPFRDGSFDAVTVIDVFECEGVRERRAWRECCRVTRPGGLLLVIAPAYAFLRSDGHHRAVHAVRRYTDRGLVDLLRTERVRLVSMTHLFALLLPVIAAVRLTLRCLDGVSATPRSEIRAVPGPVNEALYRLGRIDGPFGSSILAIVEKPA